jgi:hypothetical protein
MSIYFEFRMFNFEFRMFNFEFRMFNFEFVKNVYSLIHH